MSAPTERLGKKFQQEFCSTKFGDIPRATVEPPIVYSSMRAQPINQATLGSAKKSEKSSTMGFQKRKALEQSITLLRRRCMNNDRRFRQMGNGWQARHNRRLKEQPLCQRSGRKSSELVPSAPGRLFQQEHKPPLQWLIQHLKSRAGF